MANLNGFNANDVPPAGEFEPLPAGKYVAAIVESEWKDTSKGDGQFLKLKLQVLEGQFKNRVLFLNLNLQNRSQQAVDIARGQLSSICRAVGVMTPNDSCELHNLPMLITVGCKKREDTGDIQNEVKGFTRKEAAGFQPPAGVPANDSVPPWKR